MQNFIYQRKTELVFGKEMLDNLPKELKRNNATKVLLTYGMNSIKKTGLYDQVVTLLNENNIPFVELSGIKPNPEVDTCRTGVKLIEENNIDFVLAVGGGSVIDNSKHMILAHAVGKDIWDIIKEPTLMKGVPADKFIGIGTILTISATGSEMNNGGVISNPEVTEKMSTGHPLLTPAFSFLDPTQLQTLPRKQREAGLSDTMSHLLEMYFTSHQDEGFPDRMVEGLMVNLLNYADDYLEDNLDYDANAQVMLTATYALNGITGLGKASGDWSTHGIEHDLSARTDITHGIGLALIHPRTLEVYLKGDLEQGRPLTKFVNLGREVFKLDDSQADEVIAKETVYLIKYEFSKWIENKLLPDYGIENYDYQPSIDFVLNNHEVNDIYHTFTKEDLEYIYKEII